MKFSLLYGIESCLRIPCIMDFVVVYAKRVLRVHIECTIFDHVRIFYTVPRLDLRSSNIKFIFLQEGKNNVRRIFKFCWFWLSYFKNRYNYKVYFVGNGLRCWKKKKKDPSLNPFITVEKTTTKNYHRAKGLRQCGLAEWDKYAASVKRTDHSFDKFENL